MKKLPRLTFKPEHVAGVLAQTKTATFRRKLPQGIKAGIIVAAVTNQGAKPAFLTPVEDRFAELAIHQVETIFFQDYNEADAKAAGFPDLDTALAWYLKTDPTIVPLSRLTRITFHLHKAMQGATAE